MHVHTLTLTHAVSHTIRFALRSYTAACKSPVCVVANTLRTSVAASSEPWYLVDGWESKNMADSERIKDNESSEYESDETWSGRERVPQKNLIVWLYICLVKF